MGDSFQGRSTNGNAALRVLGELCELINKSTGNQGRILQLTSNQDDLEKCQNLSDRLKAILTSLETNMTGYIDSGYLMLIKREGEKFKIDGTTKGGITLNAVSGTVKNVKSILERIDDPTDLCKGSALQEIHDINFLNRSLRSAFRILEIEEENMTL